MDKLNSRKLIVSILTAIFVALNDAFALGVSQDAMLTIAGVIATYVLGQGLADAGIFNKNGVEAIMLPLEEGPNWEEDTAKQDAEDKKELLG